MRDKSMPLLFPEMAAERANPPQVPDAAARSEALDIRRSFVVEAPAGSGKTGLLIQRYLKLLGDESVTEPEQVLAITFTNKAAGEMRDRVLARLTEAREQVPVRGEFEQVTRELADAVLARDRQLGWRLLDQPHRINLRTIDSVCAEIARSLPVLSGGGGGLSPVENATPLFAEAAQRTLLLLGGAEAAREPEFDQALRDVLLHRDNNLADCERLIAEMLAVREQWGSLVPLERRALEDNVLDNEVLPRLQLALERAICAELKVIRDGFPHHLLVEAAALAGQLGHEAPVNCDVSPLAACAGDLSVPAASIADRERWLALKHLLTTKQSEWRRRLGRNDLRFEFSTKHPLHSQLSSLLNELREREELLELVGRLALLPPATYPAEQWRMAKSLFRVLRRALVELQLVFAERRQCDFTELSLLARMALGTSSGRDDLQSALGVRIEHLLVDEMQDTSSGHYELIERLTENWDGYSQTVFLVGDPRQSIYLFRQAKVERFMETLRTCRLGTLPLTRLRLTANFRSQRTLVEQLNEDLPLVFFDQAADGAVAAIPFLRADAVLPPSENAEGLRWHANAVRVRGRSSVKEDGDGVAAPSDPDLRMRQARRNARTIRKIATHWLKRPLPEGRSEPWKIAVLVRNRRHLAEIITALKVEEKEGRIPFRAVEIEPLGERQEILDLTALTRALLHPADRAAGFALLRAPWCGLSLGDLHSLAGEDEARFAQHTVESLMTERGELLSDDGCRRMQRLWNVLHAAGQQRGRLGIAQRVEFAWRSLGGDVSLTDDQQDNARRYLELLDEIAVDAGRSGAPVDIALLDKRLERLFAAPETLSTETAFVELLTIHRAKGLEWDVVMVPALERGQGRIRSRLLTWAELDASAEPNAAGIAPSPVMLAPIQRRGESEDELTRWLKAIYLAQEAAERKRLFYVASTRARQELHLFASPDINHNGALRCAWDSLMAAARAAAEPHFSQQVQAAPAAAAKAAWQQADTGLALAAAAEVLEMPRSDGAAAGADTEALERSMYRLPVRPEIERLPEGFDPAARFVIARSERLAFGARHAPAKTIGAQDMSFMRPEGSFAARALGNAVHALLELAAGKIRTGSSVDSLLDAREGWEGRIQALLRNEGLSRQDAARMGREALLAFQTTARDANGLWILSCKDGSATEFALSAAEESAIASIRVDRTFMAGPEPRAAGSDHLWIVDYKTATHGSSGRAAFLSRQQELYGAQLERYAAVLGERFEVPAERIRVALYYPLLPHLAWWIPGQRRESGRAEELTIA